MMFEDRFDRFSDDRDFGGRRPMRDQVILSRREYRSLKERARKYEALMEEHKKVKSWNDQLMKEMDDMKEDARKFKELQEEKERFMKQLLQIRADFDNYKKRQARENSRYKTYVMNGMLQKLLCHYDDLVRALNLMKMVEGLEDIQKGFKIVVRNFEILLEKEGIRSMESQGEKFDPYKHEALLVEEGRDDLPENTIVEVIERGYFMNDKVLRPAKVRISKHSKQLEESSLPNLIKKIEVE
jgi:molecular chaperone GrpE